MSIEKYSMNYDDFIKSKERKRVSREKKKFIDVESELRKGNRKSRNVIKNIIYDSNFSFEDYIYK